MEYEFKLDERSARVELIKKEDDQIIAKVDGKKYDLDIVNVGKGVYSILFKGKSYNVELIEGDNSKKYFVNTLYKSFNLEVIDAESRYIASRNKSILGEEGNVISSPMPGKVVKILVNDNDQVKAGDTVIIVSAMKMESEYKAASDGTIKEIMVKEGDTVASNQPLVIIE
jgi:biotin carboxyl carrier protein